MNNYDLLSFVRECGDGTLPFQLLCFWAEHKRIRLSFAVISDSLNITRARLKEMVSAFTEKGILIEQVYNGNIIYCLSEEYRVQCYMEELAQMDWNVRNRVMRELQPMAIPVSCCDR